jgi:hypothetical protein
MTASLKLPQGAQAAESSSFAQDKDKSGVLGMLGLLTRGLGGRRNGEATGPAPAGSMPDRRAPERSAGKAAESSSDKSSDRSSRASNPHVDRMRRDLKDLLGRVRGSRYVLRHLATLEYGLKKKGEAIFDDMHLPALEKAAAQLESLIEQPVSPGVSALRARVRTSVQFRRRMATGMPLRPAETPKTVAAPLYDLPPTDNAVRPAKREVPTGMAYGQGMAETMPAVLMRERISGYVADGHLEVNEVSLSHFRREATNFGMLIDLPLDMPSRM